MMRAPNFGILNQVFLMTLQKAVIILPSTYSSFDPDISDEI